MAKRRLWRALGGGVLGVGQGILAERKEAQLRERQRIDDERTAERQMELARFNRQNSLQDKGIELLLKGDLDPDTATAVGSRLNFDLSPAISLEAKRAQPIQDLIASAKRGEALGDQAIRMRMGAAKIPVDTGLPGGAGDEGVPQETTYNSLLEQDKARQVALEGQSVQEQLENIARKRSEAQISREEQVLDFVEQGPGGETFRQPRRFGDVKPGQRFPVPTTTPNLQILSAPTVGPGGARGTGFFTPQGALSGQPSSFVPEPLPAGQVDEAKSVEDAVDQVFEIEDSLLAAEPKFKTGLGPVRGTASELYNRYIGDDPDVARFFAAVTGLSNAMARPEIGSARTGVELKEIAKMLPGGNVPMNTLKTRLELAKQKSLNAINYYRRLEGKPPLTMAQYKILRDIKKLNQVQ